jgi:hypothetical protein
MVNEVLRRYAVLELSGLETDASPKTPCICPRRQPHMEREDCAWQADTVAIVDAIPTAKHHP